MGSSAHHTGGEPLWSVRVGSRAALFQDPPRPKRLPSKRLPGMIQRSAVVAASLVLLILGPAESMGNGSRWVVPGRGYEFSQADIAPTELVLFFFRRDL